MKRESEADPTDEELAKRPKMVTFEPEDLQREMMKFQNQKMSQKLKQRIRLEEELQKRVQQLEQRQTQDDALLCIINRHWNRLDEDVRILLQRFDAETSIESESQSESRATSSFLAELGHTEKREVDERLSSRVEFSRRAIGKLVQAFDRITQRNERIGHLLAEVRGGDDAEGARPEAEQAVSAERLNENVANLNIELQEENKKLQTVLTSLQKDNHLLAMRQSEADEQLAASQTRIAELQSQAEDLQYRLEKSGMREAKLDYALTELSRNSHKPALRGGKSKSGSPEVLQESSREGGGGADSSVSQAKADELTTELEEAREQSNNRLVELASLTERHKEALRDVDRLNLQLSHLPETVVVQTSEYKRLRAQYSVLHAESTKLMQQLEETRDHLTAAKIAHLRQIEQMESEELLAQKQLRSEMIHLEDQLGQVRREYEMLRVEFEQNLAANEQSGPLTKELRTLLASCKTQNQTLKADVTQFKSKWKTACSIIKDLEEQLEKERKKAHGGATGKDTPTSPGGSGEVEPGEISSPGRSESVVQDFKDQLRDLQRQLECAKHDDDASPSEQRLREERENGLLNEMEAIGQAFEDMQDQNSRLVEQLREKDDANFKLMSERIRSNQQQKMLNEEKDLITEQVVALQNQVEAQNLVVRKLEEKERLLQNTLATMDKELNLRQQVLEAHKRKAVESAQSGADLQLQLAKLQGQLDEAVGIVSEKTSSIEQEAFKYKRLQVSARACFVQLQLFVQLPLAKLQGQLDEAVGIVSEKTNSIEQEAFKYKRLQVSARACFVQLQPFVQLPLAKLQGQLDEAVGIVSEKTSSIEQEAFKYKRLQVSARACFVQLQLFVQLPLAKLQGQLDEAVGIVSEKTNSIEQEAFKYKRLQVSARACFVQLQPFVQLPLAKLQGQLDEAVGIVSEKTSSIEQEAFKYKRLQVSARACFVQLQLFVQLPLAKLQGQLDEAVGIVSEKTNSIEQEAFKYKRLQVSARACFVQLQPFVQLPLAKLQGQLDEAVGIVSEKTSSIEQEAFKYKRLQVSARACFVQLQLFVQLPLAKLQGQLDEAVGIVSEKTNSIEQEAFKYKRLQVSARACFVQLQPFVQLPLAKLQGQLDEAVGIVSEKTSSIEQEAFKYKRLQVSARACFVQLQLFVQLPLAKLQGQLDEAVGIVSEKTNSIEQEAFKYKRLQEEISILRRKLERAKKIEKASTADEVLFEEIRELKEQLTCPSCKVRRKDGILLKCHHVFCMECLRSRYETRQRKCPKCNCNFGANDFKRVYIT